MRAWTLDRFVTRPAAWLGFATGVAGIVVVTLVIELLQSFVPVLILGVVYVFAVLPVAVFWGSVASVAVAVASMLAFNFFFLPPLYTFTLADPKTLVLRPTPEPSEPEPRGLRFAARRVADAGVLRELSRPAR
jgi:K+-sensing histidine kinase KdpD